MVQPRTCTHPHQLVRRPPRIRGGYWRFVLGLAVLCVGMASHGGSPVAQDAPLPDSVTCVYPGAPLGTSLTDLAGQLGCSVDHGELADADELDQPIWVLARNVKPELALRLVSESGGIGLVLDQQARALRCKSAGVQTERPEIKGFDVKTLTTAYRDYRKCYDTPLPAEAGIAPSEILLDVVQRVLEGETSVDGGSAVGTRLVFTRSLLELKNIEELLALLGGDKGGESGALAADRANRASLERTAPRGLPRESTLGAALWRLFEKMPTPVYVHASMLESVYLDDDAIVASMDAGPNEVLRLLGDEHGFYVDARHGAMRLHQLHYAGTPAYRVFAMDALLAELEKQYREMAEGADNPDELSLKARGGISVIVDALEQQLESAGHNPQVIAYGARVVVMGGSDIIDAAVRILRELGWKEPAKDERSGK